MRLNVTDGAVRCLKEEWDFQEGDIVRVYVRYAGGGSEGFAFGIMKEPAAPGAAASFIEARAGGILFFMEEKDWWYLHNDDLTIDAGGLDIEFVREKNVG